MFRTVELPVWLFALIVVFAAVTFASHFLFPSVRWYLRRRAERLVAELNKRLERPIQPFKLARRTDMIQRLIYDPTVVEAVAEHAAETGVREDVAFQEARRYAREIVPSFSATAYFGFATRAAKWLSTRLYHVRLGAYREDELAAIDRNATIVFVMNHRSNMDYVLVTYLAAERSALSYAVGEWARVWPLQQLIRAMGAFFIRRKSRNALYRRVLARYVQLATSAGVTQAVFPEGGLSLDGRVHDPKLGLLSYIVSEFDPAGSDVVFVPVAINYDRVLEDRLLVEAGRKGVRRFRGSVPEAVQFAARYVWRRLRGQAQRFGYAAVSFGTPLSLADFSQRKSGDLTRAVGRALISEIRRVMPVLPVSLAAYLLCQTDRPQSIDTLLDRFRSCLARLERAGATVYLPNGDPSEALRTGLRSLLQRRLIEKNADTYAVAASDRDLLRFYAASIAHLLNGPGDQGRNRDRTRHKITRTI